MAHILLLNSGEACIVLASVLGTVLGALDQKLWTLVCKPC